MIIKIILIAIICIFVSSCLKPYNAEISNLVSICGGVLIFVLVCDEISQILSFALNIYSLANVDENIIKLIFKIIGIGYITEFTADIAEDFGNKIISSKVLLGGKIVICGMSIVVVGDLLKLLFSFL